MFSLGLFSMKGVARILAAASRLRDKTDELWNNIAGRRPIKYEDNDPSMNEPEDDMCEACDGTGETWLGNDYSGHKDCNNCGGKGIK